MKDLKRFCRELFGFMALIVSTLCGGKISTREYYLQLMAFGSPDMNPEYHLIPGHGKKGVCEFCNARKKDPVLAKRFNEYAMQQ